MQSRTQRLARVCCKFKDLLWSKWRTDESWVLIVSSWSDADGFVWRSGLPTMRTQPPRRPWRKAWRSRLTKKWTQARAVLEVFSMLLQIWKQINLQKICTSSCVQDVFCDGRILNRRLFERCLKRSLHLMATSGAWQHGWMVRWGLRPRAPWHIGPRFVSSEVRIARYLGLPQTIFRRGALNLSWPRWNQDPSDYEALTGEHRALTSKISMTLEQIKSCSGMIV